jgi:hypothetical protein
MFVSQIRFPYQFEEAYRQKYGNERRYIHPCPKPVPIEYAMSDLESQRRLQIYQLEKMAAERKKKLAEIRDKELFQHKYPMYPTPRQGYVPSNPISNGTRPFQTSQEGTPLIAHGSLATFPHSLRGGVLTDYKYARFILDRRAKQTAQMNDPLYKEPSPAVLTVEEKAKLDLSLILREVLTALSDGSYTESTFLEARKLTGQLITTLPLIDDEDELTELVKAIDEATEESENTNDPSATRQGIRQLQTEFDRRTAVLEKLSDLMYRIRTILVAYLDGIRRGSMSLKDRQTLVKSIARQIGLLTLADKTPRVLQEAELQRPADSEQDLPPPPPPPPGQAGVGGEGETDLANDERDVETLYANITDGVNYRDSLGNAARYSAQQLRVMLRGIVMDSPPETIANIANIPADYIAVPLYDIFFQNPNLQNNQIIMRYEHADQVYETYAEMLVAVQQQREAAADASAEGAEGTTLPEPVAKAIAEAETAVPVGQPAPAPTTAPVGEPARQPIRRRRIIPQPSPERPVPPVPSAAPVAERAEAEAPRVPAVSYRFTQMVRGRDHLGNMREVPVPISRTELKKATRPELEALAQLVTRPNYNIAGRSNTKLRNQIVQRYAEVHNINIE